MGENYLLKFWANRRFFPVKDLIGEHIIEAKAIPGVYYDLSTVEGRKAALDAVAAADASK